MNTIKKKLSLILLTSIITFSFSGCNNKNNSTNKQNTNNENNITIDGNDFIEDVVALEEFKTLFNNAITYASSGKKEDFSSLFITDSESPYSIDEMYNLFQKYATEGYSDFSYGIIMSDGTHFYVQVINSTYTGKHPNTKHMSKADPFIVSYEDNTIKFDISNNTINIISPMFEKLFPNEFISVGNNNKNATQFSPYDLSWCVPNMVINGVLVSNVYLAWQNEDGSVTCMINIKNGTSDIISLGTASITITSKDLNAVVFSVNKNINETIAPNTSKNYTFIIPADEIRTGTSFWGQTSSKIIVSNN